MANEGIKFDSPGNIEELSEDGFFLVGQVVDGENKFKNFKKEKFEEQFFNLPLESYTYAELLALATASGLVVGKQYLITDATPANISLIVQAVAVNKIGQEAKSPLFQQDVIYYNFASDVILWRWDTIRDISAAADFRNNPNFSIGNDCSNIHVGKDSSFFCWNNCNNIIIGNTSNITLTTDATNLTIGNGTNASIGQGGNNITISNGTNASIGQGGNRITIGDNNQINFLDFSSDIIIGNGNTINCGNDCETITIGNGNIITFLGSNYYFEIGNSNNLTIGGSNSIIKIGNSNVFSFSSYLSEIIVGNLNINSTVTGDCSKILIGSSNQSISIKTSCVGIIVGNNNDVRIARDSTNIKVSNNCVIDIATSNEIDCIGNNQILALLAPCNYLTLLGNNNTIATEGDGYIENCILESNVNLFISDNLSYTNSTFKTNVAGINNSLSIDSATVQLNDDLYPYSIKLIAGAFDITSLA